MATSTFLIRNETPEDHSAISQVTIEAFRPLGFETLNEPYVIEALRAAGALTISLVACPHVALPTNVMMVPRLLSPLLPLPLPP